MIVSGLIASVCFGSQLLVFKVIMRHTKDTFSIGFGFLFWCGLLGFLTLGFEVVRVPEQIQELSLTEIVGPIAVGTFTSLGIVLANIGAGLGIAGISNSIIHTSLVIVTLFNYFVFNQPLSLEQVIGILLTVSGGILLAFDDKITQCLSHRRVRHRRGAITTHVNDVPIL
jgi:drug/metabolite transporter (DMT)-like permease